MVYCKVLFNIVVFCREIYMKDFFELINKRQSVRSYDSTKTVEKGTEEVTLKENFKVEMLCECDSKEELDEMEIYFIKQFDAKDSDNFYNF